MKISVGRIQKELFKYFREKGSIWFSCNTYALTQEADFISISKSKYVYEVEIKRSKADYWNDFKNKQLKHSLLKSGKYPVNYFYFCSESDVIQPSEVPSQYGLIHIDKIPYKTPNSRKKFKYTITVVKNPKALHKKPLDDYLLVKCLSSVVFKYFNNLKAEN